MKLQAQISLNAINANEVYWNEKLKELSKESS